MDLATKYRPVSFSDVTEQSVVVDILQNICAQETLDSRNFLFIGPAGTGKTTTARIVNTVLNDGQSDPIEIDAASYSGVDSVREIIQQMRSYPLKGRYKVFIIDECFSGGMKVSTVNGYKPIEEIEENDIVYNLFGAARVSAVHKNTVSSNNLIRVDYEDGAHIICTKDHLFFTKDGWVSAKDLVHEDTVYTRTNLRDMRKDVHGCEKTFDGSYLQQGMSREVESFNKTENRKKEKNSYKNLSDMWECLSDVSKYRLDNVFHRLLREMEEATLRSTEDEKSLYRSLLYTCMPDMWKRVCEKEQGSTQVLQQRVLSDSSRADEDGNKEELIIQEYMLYLWSYLSNEESKIQDVQQRLSICSNKESEAAERYLERYTRNEDAKFGTYEEEQSFVRSKKCGEIEDYERKERNVAHVDRNSWWQWFANRTSSSFVEVSWGHVGSGVSDTNRSEKERQPESLSIELQSRPCLSFEEDCNRGGWEIPFIEKQATSGFEEGEMLAGSRVESVEIYKRGYNDERFSCCWSDSGCVEEYVTLYDIEVEGHPSYFVNDVLVHNCHSLSSSAWQALLKTLEEPPAKTVTCLCTTNPEKIPATILSRVQTFQLSKISLEGIFSRLKHILDEEKKENPSIEYEDDAILYLAKLADGGMRDGITLLTKVLAFDDAVTIDNVVKSLNIANYDEYFDLLNALVKSDNVKIVETIDSVYNSGVNFVKWFQGFHSFLCNIIKYISLNDMSKTMIPSTYEEKISKYGSDHLIVCLRLANKIFDLNKDLKDTQYLQETAITYLCSVPKRG